MRGSSKAIPCQLRPTPACHKHLASREALANFQIDQENLFEQVPEAQEHVLPPLPESPLSPSFPGFLDLTPHSPLPETTPLPDSPSSPSSLHLTLLSPLSERSYRSNSDGLSRRPPSEDDPDITEDHEDWLDDAYSFSVQLLNNHYHPSISPPSNSLAHHSPSHSVFIDSVSDPSHPTIPRSDSAQAFDKRLILIHTFLTTSTRPPDLSDSEFQSFISYATKFFVLGDKLWRRHLEGCHQLVINKPKRYELIRQAHDDLGHKGVFMV